MVIFPFCQGIYDIYIYMIYLYNYLLRDICFNFQVHNFGQKQDCRTPSDSGTSTANPPGFMGALGSPSSCSSWLSVSHPEIHAASLVDASTSNQLNDEKPWGNHGEFLRKLMMMIMMMMI